MFSHSFDDTMEIYVKIHTRDFKDITDHVKATISLKVHKIEIFFGFDFEICIMSLLVMSKY